MLNGLEGTSSFASAILYVKETRQAGLDPCHEHCNCKAECRCAVFATMSRDTRDPYILYMPLLQIQDSIADCSEKTEQASGQLVPVSQITATAAANSDSSVQSFSSDIKILDATDLTSDLTSSTILTDKDVTWIPNRKQNQPVDRCKSSGATEASRKPSLPVPAQKAAKRLKSSNSSRQDNHITLQQEESMSERLTWLEALQGPPDELSYPRLPHRTYYTGFKKVIWDLNADLVLSCKTWYLNCFLCM